MNTFFCALLRHHSFLPLALGHLCLLGRCSLDTKIVLSAAHRFNVQTFHHVGQSLLPVVEYNHCLTGHNLNGGMRAKSSLGCACPNETVEGLISVLRGSQVTLLQQLLFAEVFENILTQGFVTFRESGVEACSSHRRTPGQTTLYTNPI